METKTNKPTDFFEVTVWTVAIVIIGLLVAHYAFGYFPKPENPYGLG